MICPDPFPHIILAFTRFEVQDNIMILYPYRCREAKGIILLAGAFRGGFEGADGKGEEGCGRREGCHIRRITTFTQT
jgi:hypothetical protein